MNTTKIILIRHGQSVGNFERRFLGHTDLDITEIGYKQADKVCEFLKDEHIDVIYSSDLARAFQTAQEIAKDRDMTVQIDERFREINGGKWEDVPWDDLPHKFSESYNIWLNEPYRLQMPEGESMTEFSQRLITASSEIAQKHDGKTVCIATHGTAIRVLACHFYGWPLEKLTDVNWCDNASITVAEYDNGKFNMITDGDNEHLKDISTLEKQDWWRK